MQLEDIDTRTSRFLVEFRIVQTATADLCTIVRLVQMASVKGRPELEKMLHLWYNIADIAPSSLH